MSITVPGRNDGRGTARYHRRRRSGRRITMVVALTMITAGAAGCSTSPTADGAAPPVTQPETSTAPLVPVRTDTSSPPALPSTNQHILLETSVPASAVESVDLPEPVAAEPLPPTTESPAVQQEEPLAGSSSAAEQGSPPAGMAPPFIAMTPSRPVRIEIPSIGVDSALMDLGLQEDGTMEVPPDGGMAGWYTGAPTPGELGPAVIVGHVDWAGELGVFFNLGELEPGDHITVSRADGSAAEFQVAEVGQFAKSDFPTTAVYGDIDHPGLRVVTCGGSFDRGARSYVDNIVVFADLI